MVSTDSYIVWRKFLRGTPLKLEEYRVLCRAILEGQYSELILATIVARTYYKPLTTEDIIKLTQAYVETSIPLEGFQVIRFP